MTRARKEDGDKSNFSWLLLHNGAKSIFFSKADAHGSSSLNICFWSNFKEFWKSGFYILPITYLHVPITQECWILISFILKTPKKVYEIFPEITKYENFHTNWLWPHCAPFRVLLEQTHRKEENKMCTLHFCYLREENGINDKY
jgi:hypothetical protein